MERVRRAGVADAGRHRSRGLHRLDHVRGRATPTLWIASSRSLCEAHEARGTLRRGTGPFVPEAVSEGTLLSPREGRRAWPAARSWSATPVTTLWWCLQEDLTTVVRRVGDGRARLRRRCGRHCTILRATRSSRPAQQTLQHRSGTTSSSRTLSITRCAAGTRPPAKSARSPGRGTPGGVAPVSTDLSSPWDLAWYAGPRLDRDGRHPPAVDLRPTDPRCSGGGWYGERGAASTGLLADAWFAQTSGLVEHRRHALACGQRDVVAAVRAERDGARRPWEPGSSTSATAMAMRRRRCCSIPLGVCALPDGSVAVLDTYNDARPPLRPAQRVGRARWRPDCAEPSGAVVDGDELIVVESAAHRLTRVPLSASGRRADGPRSTPDAAARRRCIRGRFELEVVFDTAAGQKLDDRYGPATRLARLMRRRRRLLREGDGSRPRQLTAVVWCSTSRSATECCTSPRWLPSVSTTRRRQRSSRPATCISRTGASPCVSRRTAPTS